MLLSRGTGVSRLAVLIQTALIDDAQTTVVIVAGMGALHSLGQQRYDVTIVANIVVVRALTVLGYAAGNQVLHAEGAVALVGHTMDDQELHRVMFQWFHNEIVNESEPLGRAALHSYGASYGCEDGDDELNDFLDC
jgi:hypothetical protein